MSSLLHLKDVEFSYPGAEVPTLRISNFELGKGETLFLYGPSGSGKTTFLELITGILRPQQGQIEMMSTDLGGLSSHERDRFRADHMGPIFQTFNLIPYLSVLENVLLPLQWSAGKVKKVVDPLQSALLLLKELGLADKENQSVARLSVGQQQRVAVARALLGEPELIIADEPTSSLDFDHRDRFLKTLFNLCKRTSASLIFVSHDHSLKTLFDRSLSIEEFKV